MFLITATKTADVLVVGRNDPHAGWSAAADVCHLGELNDSAQGRWLKTIEVFNEAGERLH
jgi:hypothetical protein